MQIRQTTLVNWTFLLMIFGVFFIACKQQSTEAKNKANPAKIGEVGSYTVTFPSADGVLITGDVCMVKKDAPTIILCHQAGWSRGEYLEIAPKLNEMGYNTLAIDQRSGGKVNGVDNQTFLRAKEQGKHTSYLDARKDIESALKYVKDSLKTEVILWGSSYSAGLVLMIAGKEQGVSKVMAFSPGEYYGQPNYLTSKMAILDIPVFITCAKSEVEGIAPVFKEIPSGDKVFFGPKGEGEHGSRALWESKPDHREYWKAVREFLTS